jgi:thiamine-monophosphate kinase
MYKVILINDSKKLSDLGERKAIELVTSLLTAGDDKIAVGPGDDCAAIELGEFYLLVTTDMTFQKTHFPPEITPFQMGWYIVAINLSDLAAKGALPLGVVVATGMPNEIDTDFLQELIKGMNSCATKFGTAIIGGDLKSHENLTLTGTAIGIVPKSEFMPRKGAKQDDIVAVTGALGGAGAGYYALKHQVDVGDEGLLSGLFEPEPRMAEGHALAKSKVVSSSMDISDGLADSLHQLAKINKMGYEINLDDIPIDAGARKLSVELSIPIEDLTVYFGGDYELLVTVQPDGWDSAENAVAKVGGKLSRIGVVTREPELTLVKNGEKVALENRGYEHFKWTL